MRSKLANRINICPVYNNFSAYSTYPDCSTCLVDNTAALYHGNIRGLYEESYSIVSVQQEAQTSPGMKTAFPPLKQKAG